MFKLEEGWLTVLLLCAMMVVSAGGVAAAGWTEGLNAAWITGIFAIFAGLALARSRFSGGTAFLFATVYGMLVVGFFVGTSLSGNWHERALELVMRLNAFLYKVLHGGTSRDALPFPVTVSAIFWYIGMLSAWSVFRRGAVWAAVIPAGVGLLVNAYYYLGPARLDLYLAVYVLLALLFVARMNLLAREREWQSARVSYSPDLRLDFLRAGLAAALAGVLIAWAAPSLAASPQAATTWRQMTGSLSVVRESWMRMFAAIRGYGQAYNDFYTESLTLSGPARLSNTPIMDVRVNSVSSEVDPLDQVPDATIESPILRYYWRAAAYSTYADGRWALGDVTYKEFNPTQTHLQSASYRQRRQVSLAFTMHLPASSRLYIAQQMLWIDRGSNLELTFDDQGTVQDMAGVRAQQVLRRGETYQMVSSLSVANSTSLRQAGQDYPAWVTSHFLQLPPEITPRTRELAQQIVRDAAATNPFDQAQAVTQWLRDNITYDQNIEAPPADVEPVDYVLFNTLRGYCNYYASAEVILLRSLGIPARLAGGFNQGKRDPDTGVYKVLEENAHAWPEVYFPGYGWVEFEPTASEAPLVRPEAETSVPIDTGPDEEPLNDLENGRTTHEENMQNGEVDAAPTPSPVPAIILWLQQIPWTAVLITVGVIALTAVVLAIVSLRAGLIGLENLGRPGRWAMRRQGRTLPTAVALVYMQLERVANWLGLTSTLATTPFERSAALSLALPEARPGFETITAEYVAEQYSPRPADSAVAESAWHGIRLKVWHDSIRSFLLELLEDDPPKQPADTADATAGNLWP